MDINSYLPEATEENFDFYKKNLDKYVVTECVDDFKVQVLMTIVDFYKHNKYVISLKNYRFLYEKIGSEYLLPSKIKFLDIYRPYNGQDLTNKTILIIFVGGVGDIIMFEPCMRFIKEKYQNSKIIFAYNGLYFDFLKDINCIDEYRYNLPLTYEDFNKADYHIVIEDILTTGYAKTINQYRLYAKWLGLSINDEFLIPKLNPNQISLLNAQSVINQWKINKKSFILFQILSLSQKRTPNPLIWKKIIDNLTQKGHKIIITDHPLNANIINDFIMTLDNKEYVYNFAPYSVNIADTVALASLSKMTVSSDSALIHIAAGISINGLALYGSFPGWLRLDTAKNCHWIDCKAPCAPCYPFGFGACENSVNSYPICYEDIDIKELTEKIEKLFYKQ